MNATKYSLKDSQEPQGLLEVLTPIEPFVSQSDILFTAIIR